MSKAKFNHVIEKGQNCLASWKGKLLNKVGRLCLMKSVLGSILVYTMQPLWVPCSVCTRIDQLCRSMIWSGKGEGCSWNLVNWGTIT